MDSGIVHIVIPSDSPSQEIHEKECQWKEWHISGVVKCPKLKLSNIVGKSKMDSRHCSLNNFWWLTDPVLLKVFATVSNSNGKHFRILHIDKCRFKMGRNVIRYIVKEVNIWILKRDCKPVGKKSFKISCLVVRPTFH